MAVRGGWGAPCGAWMDWNSAIAMARTTIVWAIAAGPATALELREAVTQVAGVAFAVVQIAGLTIRILGFAALAPALSRLGHGLL